MEKSKTILILIESFGLGALGLDRYYMGLPSSALMKFVSFILAVTLINVWPTLGFYYFLIHAFWTIWDFVSVVSVSLMRSSVNPFKTSETVRYDADSNLAFYLAPAFFIVSIYAASHFRFYQILL